MKYFFSLLTLVISSSLMLAQDSCLIKASEWMTDKAISLRHSFDGSKNENKPASFSFKEDHKSDNDFINVDVAVKISDYEFLRNSRGSLLLYPKVEWHKSTDSSDLKNKLEGGINLEYIPFLMKSPDLREGLPNNGLKVVPWIQGTSSFKRNFILWFETFSPISKFINPV